MTEQEIDGVLQQVKTELLRANKKHCPLFNSDHEGYAVLKEEVEEMWDDIKADLPTRSCLEAIQVGAMAVKYVVSCNRRLIQPTSIQ